MQAVLFFRLGYPAAKWRNVYKGLTVLEFLLKRGAEQVCRAATVAAMRVPPLTAYAVMPGHMDKP